VIERPRVDNRCLYTHCYWRLMLDKNRDWAGPFRRLVEHSEGKGGESVTDISRFLCGSRSLCRLRTEVLVPVSKY
jgi:hypothetical protein